MGQGTCPRCPANIYRMEALIDAVKANNDGQFKLNVSSVRLAYTRILCSWFLTDDGLQNLN